MGTYLTLMLLSLTKRKPEGNADSESDKLPRISVLIPARNEEKNIAKKIKNLLEQEYPFEKLDICVSSDDSEDRTVEIVRSFDDPRVTVVDLKQRHGKLGIIDNLLPELPGEVVVITDANVFFAIDALKFMAIAYADPGVGAVSGELSPIAPEDARNIQRELSYRHFENRLKSLMSSIGCVIGSFGGFYSLRKDLFRPLGGRPIHDDVTMPLEVLAQGYKAIHVKEALAYEETNPTIMSEYTRRVRMTALNFNTLPRLIKTAWRAGLIAFCIAVGYKACRWLSPYLLLLLFISSLVLSSISIIYKVALILFLISFALAAIGWIRDRTGMSRGGITTDLYHFTAMNVAAIQGFFTWIKGVERHWEPRAM